ncbi:hypothetical protein ACFWXH_02905 [Mesorhizobium sp. NPDC059054]|uniref:hypothetical protein n=1 Tax=Mesorhizobium sp. NPDC059054 TaxID=3346711 RepID=UPI00368083EA
MADSLSNGALPDVAALPPQLKEYADIVFQNIFLCWRRRRTSASRVRHARPQMTAAENERLARLETQMGDMKAKVDEMHASFLAARCKWVIIILWIGLGAMVANVKWILAALGVKFN